MVRLSRGTLLSSCQSLAGMTILTLRPCRLAAASSHENEEGKEKAMGDGIISFLRYRVVMTPDFTLLVVS